MIPYYDDEKIGIKKSPLEIQERAYVFDRKATYSMNTAFSFFMTLIILAIRTPIIGVTDGSIAIITIPAVVSSFNTENLINTSNKIKASTAPIELAHQNVLGFDGCQSL